MDIRLDNETITQTRIAALLELETAEWICYPIKTQGFCSGILIKNKNKCVCVFKNIGGQSDMVS